MTLLYEHPSSLEHDTGAHPENAGRIRRVAQRLAERPVAGLERVEPPRATREQLERVHDPEHVARIEALCAAGGGMIDLDTYASRGSWEAALRAAGAAADAAARLLAGEAESAFCLMRPPGHHAERGSAMGFCLLNNVAVGAAEALARGAERVFVLDWDVHHGNGTEEIFKASAEVFYASIHQSPLYPGTGPADYVGEGPGRGFTLNLPVPAGTGSQEFLALVQHVVAPALRRHRPGLVAISAGYDAHRADPLATCLLDAEAYRQMALSVRSVARELGAPVLACLEGGYDPDALADSVLATLAALAGEDEPERTDPALTEPLVRGPGGP